MSTRPTRAAAGFDVLFSTVLWWHFCGDPWCSRGGGGGGGGEEGSVKQMPSSQETKDPSVTLSSSALLRAPSSFHRPRIKVALCIWKGPRLHATQISLSPPPSSPTHFTKTPSHLCHVPWRKALICRVSPLSLGSRFSFSAHRAIQPLKLWLWRKKEKKVEEGGCHSWLSPPPPPHVLLLQKSWYTSKSWSLIFYIKPFFNQEDESSNGV